MTFLISLPSVLSKTIGLNVFVESYNTLLGFGIMIDNDILKWDGQWPKSMQASAILMMFWKHISFWAIFLICLQNNLSGPGVNMLLHFKIALLNSSFKNGFQLVVGLLESSYRKFIYIW